jgi:hypothetical protein
MFAVSPNQNPVSKDYSSQTDFLPMIYKLVDTKIIAKEEFKSEPLIFRKNNILNIKTSGKVDQAFNIVKQLSSEYQMEFSELFFSPPNPIVKAKLMYLGIPDNQKLLKKLFFKEQNEAVMLQSKFESILNYSSCQAVLTEKLESIQQEETLIIQQLSFNNFLERLSIEETTSFYFQQTRNSFLVGLSSGTSEQKIPIKIHTFNPLNFPQLFEKLKESPFFQMNSFQTFSLIYLINEWHLCESEFIPLNKNLCQVFFSFQFNEKIQSFAQNDPSFQTIKTQILELSDFQVGDGLFHFFSVLKNLVFLSQSFLDDEITKDLFILNILIFSGDWYFVYLIIWFWRLKNYLFSLLSQDTLNLCSYIFQELKYVCQQNEKVFELFINLADTFPDLPIHQVVNKVK